MITVPDIVQDVANVTKIDKITENDNYELWVAKLPEVPLNCYAAINKRYKVVEMSTSVLANAFKMVGMLDGWASSPTGEEEVLGELPDLVPDPSMFS